MFGLDFSSMDPFLYVTLILGVILVILIVIYSIKQALSHTVKGKTKKAMEDHGIIMVDKSVEHDLKNTEKTDIINPEHDELISVLQKLNHLVRRDGLFRNQREQMVGAEIEKLYSQMHPLPEPVKIEVEGKHASKNANKHGSNSELEVDVKKVLNIVDDLLGNLPDEEIDKFTKSEDFKLYEKVMKKAK